jgi:hypothetical protein
LYWKNSTDKEVDETIEKIVDLIMEYKMETPALLVLPSVKPLSVMGGPLSRVFVAPWFHMIGINTRHFINTLEEPKNIERILKRIEEKEKERDALKKAEPEKKE